jgi:long-chain acyl-CoA synthetase
MQTRTSGPIPTFEKKTVNGILLWRQQTSEREIAYYAEEPDGHRPVYYAESRRVAFGLSIALRAAGLVKGDRIAILADVRHEWLSADVGSLVAGLVTVGIYPMSTPDQTRYILQHSASRLLFVDTPERLAGLAAALAECPQLETVILLDPPVDQATESTLPQTVVGFDEFVARGTAVLDAEGDVAVERVRGWALDVEPEDMATLVYTSGTTGPPKGAVISHGNLFYVSTAVHALLPFGAEDRSIVYLPLAHILMRYGSYLGMLTGVKGYYWKDIYSLPVALETVRPTLLITVPRVLEKIYAKAMARADSLRPRQRAVFDWAFEVGKRCAALGREGGKPSWSLAAQRRIADALVFSKVRAKLGGAIKLIVSGGAPLAPHISEWFHAVGILVVEGYGLTETSAPATTNLPHEYRFGTVGKAIPGTDVKIADDGEILIRGPGVFSGYYGDEAATKKAFQDGWFLSGDIGELSDDGFLKITDRKKDIIITAGGKNVAPSNIENLLKEHVLIGQAMVYGDRKPYLTAVLTLDPEELASWFQDRDLDCPVGDRALERICEHEAVVEALTTHMVDVNSKLARYETIKKWKLLPHVFDVDGGYLTPTMKMKRRVIAREFQGVFEGFYDG